MDYQKEYIDKNPNLHLEQAEMKARQILDFLSDLQYESMLDVACGAGSITKILTDGLNVQRAMGLDISEYMIEKAKILHPDKNIEWLCADIFSYEPNRRFDLVTCIDIVEHLENDLEFLKKVSTLGKNIVLKVPMEDSYLDNKIIRRLRIRDPWKESEEKYGHIHHYKESQLDDLVSSAGLRVIKESYIPLPKRSLLFYEILRVIFLPIGWFSKKKMANFVGGFKVFLLDTEGRSL